MSQGRLPVFRVVFVDWHGVLSLDPFWSSVLGGRDGRLRRALERRLDEVFGSELADTWMRGQTTVDRIVAPISEALGAARRADFLQRRLFEDCQSMQVDGQLVACLHALVRQALLVVATDNAAPFESAFRRAQRRRRFQDQPSTLRQLAPLFDDIVCSSATGVFKAEDPEAFFGPWLALNNLGFDDALLVDDRPDNCNAFERCGGGSVLWSEAPAVRQRALRTLAGFASEYAAGRGSLVA
jgi:hypothetical protein